MKIDDKLRSIKAYVLSMRYQEQLSIVDVKLKEGWKVPKSKIIGIQEYPDYPETYMFYSDKENVGIDDILSFVEEVVKINIEREKKLSLLSEKISELKTFFINHTLSELEKLKFVVDKDYESMDFDDFTPVPLDTINVIDEEGLVERPMPIIDESEDEEYYDEEEMIKEEESN